MINENFIYVGALLNLIGSISYVIDTIKGKTKPNRISWSLWALAPMVAFFAMLGEGVSFTGALMTFMVGFGPLLVLLASFLNKKSIWKITKFDIFCGLFSMISILLWVSTKNTLLSLSFAVIADLMAGIPTIKKSWTYSDTESSAPYSTGIINQIITFLIIKDFSYINIAFPIYFVLINTIIILGIYRKKIFK